MDNDYSQCPNAGSHAWRNNFATHVNGHPADSGLAAGAVTVCGVGLSSSKSPEAVC